MSKVNELRMSYAGHLFAFRLLSLTLWKIVSFAFSLKQYHFQIKRHVNNSTIFYFQRKLLKKYIYCKKIKELKLDEASSIGYTFKALGAGFWALRQSDFRQALQAITMEVSCSLM